MKSVRALAALVLLPLISTTLVAASDEVPGHRLMRFADIHGDRVVFTYEGNLWLVPSTGGVARRLTSHSGGEVFAKFSPDGSLLAFTASYDGGSDVYLMPVEGGVPTRLTWHPGADLVLDFTPDGQAVLFRSRRFTPLRQEQLFTVPVTGGAPTLLPVDRGGLASLSPDGTKLVYNRISREFRSWKRYQGGMAQDLWLADLEAGTFNRLTEFAGSDNWPMWVGEMIYFTSDRSGTMNLYSLAPTGGEPRMLTRYTDFDLKYPSAGPEAIVFQHAGALHRYDLASGTIRPVPVTLPSERLPVRPQWVDPGRNVDGFSLSPTGARLLLSARGDIYTVPAEKGDPRNLTPSQGTREKEPVWSPDGKWVAFYSDRPTDDGRREEELYLVCSRGRGEPRRLTGNADGLRFPPRWSPDSRWLAFGDKHLRLNLVDTKDGKVKLVDQGQADDAWEQWGIQEYAFSPDSRWLAYSKLMPNLARALFLYEIDGGAITRITNDRYDDFSPSWDPDGRYLHFLSKRTYVPRIDTVDMDHTFRDTVRPYLFILQEGAPSPFAPENGEEPVGEDENGKSNDKGKDKGEENGEEEPLQIDLDTIEEMERRLVLVDVPAGHLIRLEAVPGGFLYLERVEPGFLPYENPHATGRPTDFTLHRYDLEEEEDTTILEGIGGYRISADGKKLAYQAGGRIGIVEADKPAKVGDGVVDLSGLRMRLDRLAEFEQIFHEAWRVERDFFYDPGTHGVDWNALRDQFAPLVPYCGNRQDLTYLLREMVAELNIGHTYVYGGDADRPPTIPVGLLGVDLETPEGATHYRIRRILAGKNWDGAERSPLRVPGSPVRENDFLIAIDGQLVLAGENPYRHLENKAGRLVEVTVSATDDGKDPRTAEVRPLRGEGILRYRDWEESRRQVVQEAFNGDVAYMHLPDMMNTGLTEFARVFYTSLDRKGLIVDARSNGGGFVGDQIIARLARKVWAFTVPREGVTLTNPDKVMVGPLVLLIDEETGSNGEYFAQAWKAAGLGPVVGMRTWGGAVGIEPHQFLVDGGMVTPPQFAPYGWERTWLIEGHGVEPDIVVPNLPGDVLAGDDPQLERAILEMHKELRAYPPIPEHPPFPDKSKPAPPGP